MVQMGAIEIHPWGARVDSIDYPDRMIFDLDPAPDVRFEPLSWRRRRCGSGCKKKVWNRYLKSTGGKGLHVTVPLAGKDKWADGEGVCGRGGRRDGGGRAVSVRRHHDQGQARRGKIFIDFFRNDYTATAIADYGVRARPGAPVALPLDWRELEAMKAANQFTIADVLKRIARRKPPSRAAKPVQRIPAR